MLRKARDIEAAASTTDLSPVGAPSTTDTTARHSAERCTRMTATAATPGRATSATSIEKAAPGPAPSSAVAVVGTTAATSTAATSAAAIAGAIAGASVATAFTVSRVSHFMMFFWMT
jgi:hypothetical protein